MDKKYQSIYIKNGLEVFVNPEDYWADYKVRLNGYHAKSFKGETAWMEKILRCRMIFVGMTQSKGITVIGNVLMFQDYSIAQTAMD